VLYFGLYIPTTVVLWVSCQVSYRKSMRFLFLDWLSSKYFKSTEFVLPRDLDLNRCQYGPVSVVGGLLDQLRALINMVCPFFLCHASPSLIQSPKEPPHQKQNIASNKSSLRDIQENSSSRCHRHLLNPLSSTAPPAAGTRPPANTLP
jgi:hypothetical protein